MVRVDARTARALAHLRNPEMAPFVEFLRAKRLEALELIAQSNLDQQIYRSQGEAGLLKEILELIEGAEALLAKLKQ